MNNNYNPNRKARQNLGHRRSVFSDTSSSSDEEDSDSEYESDSESDEEEEVRKLSQGEKREARGPEKQNQKTTAEPLQSEEEEEEKEQEEEEAEQERSAPNLTKVALRDLVRKHENVTRLSSLLIHFIFGSRDIVQEDPKTDRSVSCTYPNKV